MVFFFISYTVDNFVLAGVSKRGDNFADATQSGVNKKANFLYQNPRKGSKQIISR